ncbi:MAG: hypothetical protein ACTHOK_00180 [Nocardioidaceae bacterium]
MVRFEWMFVTDAVTDELETAIEEEVGGFVGGHGPITLVTVDGEGGDALEVGHQLVRQLEDLGVTTVRAYPDLVTRKTIASRARVTTQAVGLWTRGERHKELPFPEPFTLAAGGLWLWSDVNAWLKEKGLAHDEVEYPTRSDLDALNVWLEERRTTWPGSTTEFDVITVLPVVSGQEATELPWPDDEGFHEVTTGRHLYAVAL